MKIPWSGRSHNFDKKDIGFLVNIIKEADPLTQGKFLEKFESIFSKYIGKKNVFAVSSAAAALEIIALLADIKKDDEVIISTHTMIATASAISAKGLEILLPIDNDLIAFISSNSSSFGGISGVLKTDHKIVTNDRKAPI